MHINDNEILHKIIEFQTCIINGKSIKSILRKNIDFFLQKSKADIITLYMHEHQMVNPEYIMAKNQLFLHLLKKYILDKKNFKWDKFVHNCDKHFSSGIAYDEIKEFYQLFRGFINKRESASFTDELQMKSAIMMPLYTLDNKEIMGYVCFIFQSDIDIDVGKLETVKTTLQILVQPMYDREQNCLYNKCIRIDENMNFLTKQEKIIVKKVLTGASYTEVATSLNISINTLKTHMKNIFNKSNVSSKIELFNKFHIRL